jgi:hypothetical protein
MFTPATPDHHWLRRFLGEWTYESSCEMGPGQPPMRASGRERVRMLGDLWVVGESEGEMPGGPDGAPATMTAIITLGFDPAKGRYVGTWVGSPMASMFVYEGQREGDRLPLDTVGPSFEDHAKLAHYQDVVTFVNDHTRTLESRLRGNDGAWTTFMRATYTRVR